MTDTWQCAVCGDHDPLWPSTDIEESPVCRKCIRDLFDHSLTSDINFPPRWGKRLLDPWDYRHLQIFDTRWLAAYSRKEAEWACPDMERVYCEHADATPNQPQCGTFIGRMVNERDRRRKCDACKWYTCLRCCVSFNGPDSTTQGSADPNHRCDPRQETKIQDRAFAGLKRGKDWQQCPKSSCQRKVQLWDGCNHMVCPGCSTEFCYICGGRTTKGSYHWNPDGCPQFGQPGITNAVFARDADELDGDGDLANAEFNYQYNLMMERERTHQQQVNRDTDRRSHQSHGQPVHNRAPTRLTTSPNRTRSRFRQSVRPVQSYADFNRSRSPYDYPSSRCAPTETDEWQRGDRDTDVPGSNPHRARPSRQTASEGARLYSGQSHSPFDDRRIRERGDSHTLTPAQGPHPVDSRDHLRSRDASHRNVLRKNSRHVPGFVHSLRDHPRSTRSSSDYGSVESWDDSTSLDDALSVSSSLSRETNRGDVSHDSGSRRERGRSRRAHGGSRRSGEGSRPERRGLRARIAAFLEKTLY